MAARPPPPPRLPDRPSVGHVFNFFEELTGLPHSRRTTPTPTGDMQGSRLLHHVTQNLPPSAFLHHYCCCCHALGGKWLSLRVYLCFPDA